MPVPFPNKLIDRKPVTVSVQLPANWMADYFADWVAGAFIEQILAYEGQHLITHTEDRDQVLTVVFEKDNRQED